MKNKNLIYGILISLLFVFSGCEDLLVENLNNPDSETALGTPEDLAGLAGGLMNNFINGVHEYDGIALALAVAADTYTCSHGNSGMNDSSKEPRIAWNNTASYGNANCTREYYLSMNGVNSLANSILKQIVVNGLDAAPEVEAFARLGQGISLGYIGLVFDQAFILDETTDLVAYEAIASPYEDVITAALTHLDECIAICNANTFTIPASWIQGDAYDNVKLGKLANSYAARLLAYSPRTLAENNAVNWGAVKTYASNGMDEDFFIEGDNENWSAQWHGYANNNGWARVDMRVVHMLDPNQPARFPSSGLHSDLPNDGLASAIDARLTTDFQYLTSNNFRPSRGSYHYSTYRFKRIDHYTSWPWSGTFWDMRAPETEMLLAEAELRLGNVSTAANIVNASTYVTRGGLNPVDANATEVETAIFYERTIELFCTGPGTAFFDMRRRDMLQIGTPLHYPIPAAQLGVMQLPLYSFGGVSSADGVNTSNGGWD